MPKKKKPKMIPVEPEYAPIPVAKPEYAPIPVAKPKPSWNGKYTSVSELIHGKKRFRCRTK